MTARRVAGGSVFVGVTAVAAAVAAWPVYASWQFAVLAAVAAAVGAGIAALVFRRRWSPWRTAALLAGAFILLCVPLAVPARLGGPVDLLRGLGEAAAGVVLAWKDLITVDLPVGAYRNLLVPALVIFLAGTCGALLLSWRSDRWAIAAVPVGFGMLGFGLFFGRTEVSDPLRVGAVTLYAPAETLLGVVGLLSAVLWLAWRTHDERVRALYRAATASGVRVSRRPSRTDRRRTALGAAMVSLALVAAVAIVPWAARGADRDVLRSAAGPEREIAAAVSPLTQYRALFAPERADDVLFRVSGEGRLPERVRVATLDTYDGETFRAGSGDPGASASFVRVPAALDAGEGAAVEAEIAIEALEGIWLPTVGRVSSVEFAGERAAALADRFYYSAHAQAGVVTAGAGPATATRTACAPSNRPRPIWPPSRRPATTRRRCRRRTTSCGGSRSTRRVRTARPSRASWSCCASAASSATRWRSTRMRRRRGCPSSRPTRSSPAPRGTPSPASTRCSRVCSNARATRGQPHPGTSSPPWAMRSSSPWPPRSSRASWDSPRASCWARG
ncbi:DUF3488 domain-containing protein [Microbacterium lushaniae]|uniref:DUF3488 domain-containing protein n=1 Tax=Microbacterium lushaniae TaxID=2614639 RepID=UPI001EE99356|nr:transglutaminaseTgpA domain-containing protein [Microbacterium lushaniae]